MSIFDDEADKKPPERDENDPLLMDHLCKLTGTDQETVKKRITTLKILEKAVISPKANISPAT